MAQVYLNVSDDDSDDDDDGFAPPSPRKKVPALPPLQLRCENLWFGTHDCGAVELHITANSTSFSTSRPPCDDCEDDPLILEHTQVTHIEMCKTKASCCLWGYWEWPWSASCSSYSLDADSKDARSNIFIQFTDSVQLADLLKYWPKLRAAFVSKHKDATSRSRLEQLGAMKRKLGGGEHSHEGGGQSGAPAVTLRARNQPVEVRCISLDIAHADQDGDVVRCGEATVVWESERLRWSTHKHGQITLDYSGLSSLYFGGDGGQGSSSSSADADAATKDSPVTLRGIWQLPPSVQSILDSSNARHGVRDAITPVEVTMRWSRYDLEAVTRITGLSKLLKDKVSRRAENGENTRRATKAPRTGKPPPEERPPSPSHAGRLVTLKVRGVTPFLREALKQQQGTGGGGASSEEAAPSSRAQQPQATPTPERHDASAGSTTSSASSTSTKDVGVTPVASSLDQVHEEQPPQPLQPTQQPPMPTQPTTSAAPPAPAADWEAEESTLSFATKLLVWEQQQVTVRLLREQWLGRQNGGLGSKTLRVSRERLKETVLGHFGTGPQGLKVWATGNAASAWKRMLQPLRVEFTSSNIDAADTEDGVDQGGLSADLFSRFFTDALKDTTIFEVVSGAALPSPRARCHHAAADAPPCGKCAGCEAIHNLAAVGRVLARQALDGWVAPGFGKFVWHFLRDSHETALESPERALAALASHDESLAQTWRNLLHENVEQFAYPLTLEDFTNLPADGDVRLTEATKHGIIRDACRQRLLLCRRPGLDALREGFAAGGFHSASLRLWSVPELMSLFHGNAVFSARPILDTIVFHEECCAEQPKQLLKALLADDSWQYAKEFLEFCTSLSVLPPDDHPQSLKSRRIVVHSNPPGAVGGDASNTPTASTCARTLYLPEVYADVEVLKDRFDLAFKHMATSGFRYA